MQASEERIDSIKAFSRDGFHRHLEKFDVPTLIIHGGMTIRSCRSAASAMLSSKLVRNATLKIYSGGPHAGRHAQDLLNADLLPSSPHDQRRTGCRALDQLERVAPYLGADEALRLCIVANR